MNHPQPTYQHSLLTPFWRGVLAVQLLWILVLWGIAGKSEHFVNTTERSNAVAAQDIPLHASGEYSLSVKRLSRHQDSYSSPQISDPNGDYPSVDIRNLLHTPVLSVCHAYAYFPICLHQLQALNSPCAPPFV